MKKELLLKLAKREIDNKRYLAEEECEIKLKTLRCQYPRFREYEKEYRIAQFNFAMSNNKSTEEIIELEKCKSKYLNILNVFQLTENDLKPQYSCRYCNDTGYVDFHICSCLQTEINKLIAQNSSVSCKSFTFENSTETDEHNVAVYSKAQYSVSDGKSILLTGDTGTGKTYLLNACCNLAVSENKSTQLLTAYDINSLFLECHLSDLATQQAILDSLVDVDVLAIDDLGTETIYKNVSAQYLFMIINERVNRCKQTFVSTNLNLNQLREQYDERIFSRLLDKNMTFIAKLQGYDKRLSI